MKAFAERNGISLVLQYDGSPVDQKQSAQRQNEVMKLVVYQNGLDISTIVLEELNRRAAGPGNVAPKGNPGNPGVPATANPGNGPIRK